MPLALLAIALAGACACTIPVWRGWSEASDMMRPAVRPREIVQQWLLGHWLPVWSTTGQFHYGSPSLALYHRMFFETEAVLMLAGIANAWAMYVALVVFMVLGVVIMAYAVRRLLGQPHPAIEAICGLLAISCNFATTDWLVRNDFAEFAAQMLLPAMFVWCFVLIGEGRFSRAIGPIMVLLVLAHSGTAAYCFIPLGLAVLIAGIRRPRAVLAWVKPALVSGAFFMVALLPVVLPAVPMFRYANIDMLSNVTPAGTHRPFRDLFADAPWDYLFSESIRIDPGLLVAGAALVGLLVARSKPARGAGRDRVWIGWFLVAVVAICLVLQLRAALPFYGLSRALGMIQFTWRLLTFISVALILAAALVAASLPGRPVVPVICALALLASTVPNKFWPSEHHVRLLSGRTLDTADLGEGDPPEYTPRIEVYGTTLDQALQAVSFRNTPPRCPAHWATDMTREEARATLDVTCPTAGPTALPFFHGPGMTVLAHGSPLALMAACFERCPVAFLPAGVTRITVIFPTWWSVVTGRRLPRRPECPASPGQRR